LRHFFDWFADDAAARSRPWLILGKGPSFDRRGEFDLSGYELLALNHAVRELPVTAAHAIDIDVVQACGEAIERNARVLAMPWFPHENNAPGTRSLEDWAREIPALGRLAGAGRLLWYDLRTARERHGDRPVVQAWAFSAEAALSLLGLAGARRVRSLGVDGGTAYSPRFADAQATKLNNRQASFDAQFRHFPEILARTGVDFAPLDVESPIRIFVGSEEPQMLAVKVLEHSIRRHASMAVEVVPLHAAGIAAPVPKDPRNKPRKPFSFHRFAIPKLCGGRGRAIYIDSDMQVFADIRELWTLPFDGADLLAAREPGATGRRPQFSVMLLDCAALAHWSPEAAVAALDSGALSYEKLMYDMALAGNVRAGIDPAWNSLERFVPGETRLVHYTDMDRQPWVARRNPLNPLWVRGLLDAVADGWVTRDEVADHVARGWVRPSLLLQVDRRIERLGPLAAVHAWGRDRRFVPPYKALAPQP
jgi:hypothetical protein